MNDPLEYVPGEQSCKFYNVALETPTVGWPTVTAISEPTFSVANSLTRRKPALVVKPRTDSEVFDNVGLWKMEVKCWGWVHAPITVNGVHKEWSEQVRF